MCDLKEGFFKKSTGRLAMTTKVDAKNKKNEASGARKRELFGGNKGTNELTGVLSRIQNPPNSGKQKGNEGTGSGKETSYSERKKI